MSNPKRRTKSGFVLLIILAVLAVGGYFAWKLLWKRNAFALAGTLRATKVDLSPQLASRIEGVTVQEGDRVKDGQELIKLSCEDVHVASQLAKQNYDRNLKLFKVGTVSKDALDQFTNRLEDTELRLKWCSLTSPISGTVLSRYHEPGEWVSPGLKILTLANIRDIWTYIYVPQEDMSKLKVGDKLTGVVPELNREFQGQIIKINDEAEFTPKNVQTRSERTRLVYGIKVSFLGANNDEILKPGMTIEITLPTPKD